MKTVSSLKKSPAVQAARALRDARERARQGAFLLDGEHMVGEALAACPDRVSALFVDEARLEAYAALTALGAADSVLCRALARAGGHLAGQNAAGRGGGLCHAPVPRAGGDGQPG